MTLKELREYRLICSEIDYIDKCMQCSTDKKSSVARLKRKSELIKEKNRLESFLESINNFKIRLLNSIVLRLSALARISQLGRMSPEKLATVQQVTVSEKK